MTYGIKSMKQNKTLGDSKQLAVDGIVAVAMVIRLLLYWCENCTLHSSDLFPVICTTSRCLDPFCQSWQLEAICAGGDERHQGVQANGVCGTTS